MKCANSTYAWRYPVTITECVTHGAIDRLECSSTISRKLHGAAKASQNPVNYVPHNSSGVLCKTVVTLDFDEACAAVVLLIRSSDRSMVPAYLLDPRI